MQLIPRNIKEFEILFILNFFHFNVSNKCKGRFLFFFYLKYFVFIPYFIDEAKILKFYIFFYSNNISKKVQDLQKKKKLKYMKPIKILYKK